MASAGEDSKSIAAALSSSYDEQIRPLLDAVDRLRHLKVMQEGIQLPTIVVVGDQSSGKSSNDPSIPTPVLHLEYKERRVHTSEADVTAAIEAATTEIAGSQKGISDEPITLVVQKKGVPDLTMVDLPGITRVPVSGQPENIYEQIAAIIMKYIRPQESIILNVLSASVDFPTCESIRMSQQVDRNGERTIAVVTKVDKSPDGLLEKVTSNDVGIGLGYVCVRNRIGSETYDEARAAEAKLFNSHPLLSVINKSIVGVPVLAEKLMQIQAQSIAKCLPDIVKKINEKLNRHMSELDNMPRNLSSVADAMRAFMGIISKAMESLSKLLVRGEFDEFPEDKKMHGTARISEMLNAYSGELPSDFPTENESFLMEEIEVLRETRGIGLPNFLPRSAFLVLLQKKINGVSSTPEMFVLRVWEYVEQVVIRVFNQFSENYPPLQASIRRAVQNLMEKMRQRSRLTVREVIEMEMLADYTSNPDYMKTWAGLMEQQEEFMEFLQNCSKPSIMNINGIGIVEIAHLRQQAAVAEQAFDIRMRLIAYWKIVVLRLVDVMVLHVLRGVKKLVESDIEGEILNDVVGGTTAGRGIERMLEESPVTAGKRERLWKSVQLLKESKQVVAKIMDPIAITAD
ncbi:Dynamin-related protein 4C [Apostasia shenzhenica]|uniref:Dynamin-related protein 4C n=1 Tax=Apostasia shenzhenica TaxID=1088818 RepID=A0A2I0B5F8_9ASPA|nr:Dynamin-related protein 4C [Apostasia shenzhenica]